MSPEAYILLAILLTLSIGLIIIIQRIDRSLAQADSLREQMLEAKSLIIQQLRNSAEVEVAAQLALHGIIKAQGDSIEANTRAADATTGAIKDLSAALIESTKL